MDDSDLTRLQERFAHVERTVNDLSDVVARQDAEIATLTKRLGLLLERAAEREFDEGGSIPLADQRPPHY